MLKTKILYGSLLMLGLTQMAGLMLHMPKLRGLGLASVAAPLPLVFSHFRNHETFAADFTLRLKNRNAIVFDQPITPSIYAQLKGPYNRRNVYGAVFAYGAYLNRPNEQKMVQAILRHGFCNNGQLSVEFNLQHEFDEVQVLVTPKTLNHQKSYKFGATCL